MHSNLLTHQGDVFQRPTTIPPPSSLQTEYSFSPLEGHHQYLICIRGVLQDKYLFFSLSIF